MDLYQLKMESAFINPTWLNKVQFKRLDTIVLSDGSIEIEGEKLTFKNDTLPPETKITVWLDRFFVCATHKDIKNSDRQRLLNQEVGKLSYRDNRNRSRTEAIDFNAKIKLPVKWDVGIKHVLSGLSETSQGNGTNKATITHIFLLEDLVIGRLKRSKGSFLCSANPKQNGMNYLGYKDVNNGVLEFERLSDGDGNKYQPQVTCKSCLQILELIRTHALKQNILKAAQAAYQPIQKPISRRR